MVSLLRPVLLTVTCDIGKKYVGGVIGIFNTMCTFGGFVFSVSFGYFVTWFGNYDLALIPVALTLAIGTLAWLRIDATEELIPEDRPEVLLDDLAAVVV